MKKVLFLIPLLFLTTSCKKNPNSNVLEYEIKADNTYRVFLSDNSKTKSVTIPKTYKNKAVSEIGGFRNNDYIENVKFYGNITNIEDGTFSFCKNLKTISVEKSDYYSSTDGILYKNDYLLVYPSGKKDRELTIDKSIKSKAFTLCPNIEKITIKSKIVEDNSFYYLESLNEVVISDSVKTINDKFIFGKKIDKLIIKNKNISESLYIDYAKEIYIKESFSLSTNTLENYTKTNQTRIDNEVYDMYILIEE